MEDKEKRNLITIHNDLWPKNLSDNTKKKNPGAWALLDKWAPLKTLCGSPLIVPAGNHGEQYIVSGALWDSQDMVCQLWVLMRLRGFLEGVGRVQNGRLRDE